MNQQRCPTLEFEGRMKYFKNIPSTEAGYTFQPEGGLRSNIILHPNFGQLLYATADHVHIIELDGNTHHAMKIQPSLEPLKNYHIKLVPDANNVILSCNNSDQHAYQMEPFLI